MDGLDIVHIHWTQAHPETPLKMEILHYGEMPFEGPLKGKHGKILHLLPQVVMGTRDSPANHQAQ
jgi:hypothetical protein